MSCFSDHSVVFIISIIRIINILFKIEYARLIIIHLHGSYHKDSIGSLATSIDPVLFMRDYHLFMNYFVQGLNDVVFFTKFVCEEDFILYLIGHPKPSLRQRWLLP